MRRLGRGVGRLVAVLPPTARGYLRRFVFGSCVVALLDLAALALLAAWLRRVEQGPGQVLGADSGRLLAVVCGLLVGKAGLAILLQWHASRRFCRYELQVGDELLAAYLHSPWARRPARSTAELVRLADVGIANTVSGVLLPCLALPQQAVTLGVVVVVVGWAAPGPALVALGYLTVLAVALYLGIGRRALAAGQRNLDYSLRTVKLVTEMVHALKEITLRRQAAEVAAVVHAGRVHATAARARLHFLGTTPPRLLEAGLVGGVFLVGAFAYLTAGPRAALSAVALFVVAGFRLGPAIVQTQTILTTASSNLPHLEAVLADIEQARALRARPPAAVGEGAALPDAPRALRLRGVTYRYPGQRRPAVQDLTVTIPLGSSFGIVGPSGAGKTTLADLLVGLLPPTAGQLLLDNRPLAEVLAAWQARIGYVPQEVALFDASLAQNVALTWGQDIDLARVAQVLGQVRLGHLAQRPGGLHAQLGERGLTLSGGERQRLGLARALYPDPRVLVLDEATAALDPATEQTITATLRSMHGKLTVITIAHRLTTVRHYDQLGYLRAGRLVAVGSFAELVATEPDFAHQARLAGLV
ncbi:ATP-binding cassette domain-containing protein [Buchananella hordeovulneris]|uniref:ATP-binding cassette domain-containing protein n=1 Tax=Buchananella hordeovulneris TaxID=52770 RepID=UPI0026DBCA7F|nr:ATP-binding cassette domain-containing protein [Buchananella hordeovulneris]MDO5079785.1 ATP-binding cassette domain-containing protein [Buchananella hordeovulneris]